jgi:signal recognition particle subunit SRP54
MTPEERANPAIINASRRKRIAAGSGTKIDEVNRLLKQFNEMRTMMKSVAGASGSMKNPLKMAQMMRQMKKGMPPMR